MITKGLHNWWGGKEFRNDLGIRKAGMAALCLLILSSVLVQAQEHQGNQVIEKALDAYTQAAALDQGQDSMYLRPSIQTIDVLSVRQEDVRDVLDAMALKTGLLIIPDEDIRGLVTIELKDVNVDDALRILLQPHGWAYMKEDHSVYVMGAETFEETYGYPFSNDWTVQIRPLLYTKAEEILIALEALKGEAGQIIHNPQSNTLILLDEPQRVRSMIKLIEERDVQLQSVRIELKFIPPQQVLKEIDAQLTPQRGQVQYEAETRTVVITDFSHKLKALEAFVRQKDLKPQKILVETKILQVTLNDEHLKGIDWEAIVSEYQSFEFLGFEHKRIEEGGKGLSIGLVSKEDYGILVEALDTVGIVQPILEQRYPRVDQENLVIPIKPQDDPQQEKKQQAQEDASSGPRQVRMYARTKVMDEQTLRLQLKPKVIFNQQSKAPWIEEEDWSQQRGTVWVDLKEEATAVIGGLFKNITVDVIKKIPLLGDIPFLGFAFRNQKTQERKTEIILFITPRRVNE